MTSISAPVMDRYAPIKRLAMRVKPASPTKPVTAFGITDILNDEIFGSRKRPFQTAYTMWSSSPPRKTLQPSLHRHLSESPKHSSSHQSESESESDIEIDVTDDDDVSVTSHLPLISKMKVSPLDALLNMTKTTFDPKNRDSVDGKFIISVKKHVFNLSRQVSHTTEN